MCGHGCGNFDSLNTLRMHLNRNHSSKEVQSTHKTSTVENIQLDSQDLSV